MAKKMNFIIILALSAMMMSLSSCSTLIGAAYTLSGGANLEKYTHGYNPIPVGENAYITPGKSAKVEYGIPLEVARKKLPSDVIIRRVIGQFRDKRGFIGWAFVCYEADTMETREYTVTQAGWVRH